MRNHISVTSEKIEQALRDRARILCDRHPDLPRLRTVAAVGAYGIEIGGYDDDSQRLTGGLTYLLDSGVPVDPDFTVDVVNFADGRDFLYEETPVDFVFVAYILRHAAGLPQFWPDETDRESCEALLTTVSRCHDKPGWLYRLREGNTKMVMAYGGGDEIDAQYFCNGHEKAYRLLVPAPNMRDQEIFYDDQGRRHSYDISGLDVPITGLSFCADHEYLEAIAPALNRKTYLGRLPLHPVEKPRPPAPFLGYPRLRL